ncbi:MAG: hypothetical protein M3198_12550 [Actinomycetota bacterium]|nr:hypothetical protein [Actinomycetota bacterium]
MNWILLALLIPGAAMAALLVKDFMRGLGSEHAWSDPALEDGESRR